MVPVRRTSSKINRAPYASNGFAHLMQPLALQLLASCCSLLLGSCTMSPQTRQTRYPEADARFAEQSAYAGLRDKDGFSIPQAKAVSAPSEPELIPTPAGELSSKQLGLATLTWGEYPPFSEKERSENPGVMPFGASASKMPTAQPSNWRLTRSINVNEGYLFKVLLTANEQEVVTLSTDSGTIYHYDITTGKLLNKISIPNFTRFEDVDFTVIKEIRERSQLLISRESGASLLDLQSGRFDALTDIPAGNGVSQTATFGLYETSIRRIDPQSGQLSFYWLDGSLALRADCRERPEGVSLSRDGKWLAVSYYPADIAQVLDLERKELIAEFNMPRFGGSVALSPDKSLIALGGEHLELRRVSDLSLVGQDLSFKNNIHDIQFSPDADLLLVSAYDGKIRSYALPLDLSTLQALPTPQLLNHKYMTNVYGLALSNDGRQLISASGDQTIKIWSR